MRASMFLAVALLAFSAMLARPAMAAQISIDPPNPSVGDSVKIVVQSGFPSACWIAGSTNCVAPLPDSAYAIVDVHYCGAPSCLCSVRPVAVAYQRICNLGLLPAGSYVAAFFENHINPADPTASFVITLPFTVTGPTPVLRRTWGAVKSYFH